MLTIGTAAQSSSSISVATRLSVVVGSQLAGSGVITSRTFMPLATAPREPPRRDGAHLRGDTCQRLSSASPLR